MTGDVEVKVTGLPFNQKAVSGVSISYSFNMIPTASIQLVAPYIEENHRDFLCDPDKFKKQTRDSNVTIEVKSKTGCIKFEGVFDGMSFSQTPGGFSYSAIIKSKFQVMMELYPKFIGIDPISMLPFKRVTNLKTQMGNSDDPYESFRDTLTNVPATDKTVIRLYVDLIKALVDSQIKAKLASNTTQNLAEILELFDDERYKQNMKKCFEYLSEEVLDLSFAEDTPMRATRCLNYLVERVMYSQDTLWDTLVSTLDEMGCMLLAGNSKLFIAPKVNYLKMTGLKVPAHQGQAVTPNHIYPSDYTTLNVNDVPYRNLRGCFVVPVVNDPGPLGQAFVTQCLGAYPKKTDTDIQDDGSSGILIINAPTFLIQNIDGLYVMNDKVQTDIKTEGKAYAGEVVESSDQPQQEYQKLSEDFAKSIEPVKEILNKYAKSRFLQEKYSERGGTVNAAVFKPNIVPGTTGFLFSRHPGLFYNFFVTSVTHSVTLGSGKVGSATTQINFNSLRYAGSADKIPGTDAAELYNFDSSSMESLQNQWILDVAGVTGPNKSS